MFWRMQNKIQEFILPLLQVLMGKKTDEGTVLFIEVFQPVNEGWITELEYLIDQWI